MKTMTATTAACPFCNQPARLVMRPARVRRGDRVLPVELETWECSAGCTGPEGESPFRFVDRPLGRRNDEAAREAWESTFGEPMPEARRPGRKPPEKRDVPVHVMLTHTEVEELDRLRGEVSRSQFIRERTLSR